MNSEDLTQYLRDAHSCTAGCQKVILKEGEQG